MYSDNKFLLASSLPTHHNNHYNHHHYQYHHHHRYHNQHSYPEINNNDIMASASSSSARHLFSDSKRRLADRVNVNVNNVASVARQIVRGSKSNDMLMQSARNLAQLELNIESSLQALKKMELIRHHMGYQYDAIEENAKRLEYLKEQVIAMER